MLNLHLLSEFSREHCVAICAFLVPANLIATIVTLAVVFFGRSQKQIGTAASVASVPAIAMFFHVLSWFAVGVVMAPTYILFTLGTVCLLINGWAIVHSLSLQQLMRAIAQRLKRTLKLA
ncbi:MAG: hypothetical protein F6K32_11610 [Desertifilum sp. SIO1I2]|nr:hypothetical protein [Desertifilum sp. SIO1I2]